MMDLKSFREDNLKLKTQAEFAELLGVEVSQVSQWETNSGGIELETIQLIMEKTAVTFEVLTGWKKPKPKPLNVDNTWKKVDFTKKSVLNYINSCVEELPISEEEKTNYIDRLQAGVIQNITKPQVIIVGRSDTGKSTLINALLGVDKMPASWTPTTSIAVYLKHIQDKPDFIKEDAWIFASKVDSESMWDEQRLYDEEYCRKWKIGAGGAEILKTYGTRQGEHYTRQAGSAVIFIDSPALLTCDIVDLPGFGTETEADDNITLKTARRADVIIYLSQANGFMRVEDGTYLKQNIATLPVWENKNNNSIAPLANLFIVASQAHAVNNGNREQLKNILDTGCSNLLKTLPTEYWTARKKSSGYTGLAYEHYKLRSRFFTYTTDIPDLSADFHASLKIVLEQMPEIIHQRAIDFVRNYIKARKPNLEKELEKYLLMVTEKEKYDQLLKAIKVNEPERAKNNSNSKQEILSVIQILEKESKNEFSDFMAKTLNTDNLVTLLKQRKIQNKKDEVEQFGSLLQSMVQERCELILAAKSESLSKKTENYIKSFSDEIKGSFEKNNLQVDFDAGWAFTSTLVKLGLAGGLSSFLAGMGIFCFGSTALIMGGVGTAAVVGLALGPIGVALGLVLTAGLGVVRLFGGGWEKQVAKKIVDCFEKNQVSDNFRNAIDSYWDESERAFLAASDGMEQEWRGYIQTLEDALKGYDIDQINNKIQSLECVSDFFDHIPL